MAYESVTTHYKAPGWPGGIPGVEDEAGVIVCICPQTHGEAFSMLIASALNEHSENLERGNVRD